MIMSCPVCEGQGNIYKAKVVDLGINIKICDECEACWTEDQVVTINNFKGLTTFLKDNGLKYDNADIENLEYITIPMNNPKIPIFFITGTSGSGKTTLVQQLKKIIPSQSFAIYDFDERGVPENPDKTWRIATTTFWLGKAQENHHKHKTTIICGVSVPSEINTIIQTNRLSIIPHFGFIKVDEKTIEKRLQDRQWNKQSIIDNINWAHYLEKEAEQQKNFLIIDTLHASSRENIAQQCAEWIQSSLNNHISLLQ